VQRKKVLKKVGGAGRGRDFHARAVQSERGIRWHCRGQALVDRGCRETKIGRTIPPGGGGNNGRGCGDQGHEKRGGISLGYVQLMSSDGERKSRKLGA